MICSTFLAYFYWFHICIVLLCERRELLNMSSCLLFSEQNAAEECNECLWPHPDVCVWVWEWMWVCLVACGYNKHTNMRFTTVVFIFG